MGMSTQVFAQQSLIEAEAPILARYRPITENHYLISLKIHGFPPSTGIRRFATLVSIKISKYDITLLQKVDPISGL